MSVNTSYVQWLTQWIQTGTINMSTGKPFVITDIKNPDYATAVINSFKSMVANNQITPDQYQQYTGQTYSA